VTIHNRTPCLTSRQLVTRALRISNRGLSLTSNRTYRALLITLRLKIARGNLKMWMILCAGLVPTLATSRAILHWNKVKGWLRVTSWEAFCRTSRIKDLQISSVQLIPCTSKSKKLYLKMRLVHLAMKRLTKCKSTKSRRVTLPSSEATMIQILFLELLFP